MYNIRVTGMSLLVWRTVVSLLGGFPALRDAAGTKGESWVVLCCAVVGFYELTATGK